MPDMTDTPEDQTAIRHRLLDNGYVPLANVDKRCMLRGWPTLEVDHDLIDEWAEMRAFRATGVRMAGDMVALDFDIDDDDMLDRIWAAVEKSEPGLFDVLQEMPMRGGKGAKICLFGRLETGKIDKLWSKAYYAPGARERDGTGAVLQRLEVFTGSGSGGARQVGVYGAHTVVNGEVVVSYRWADGRGLCEVGYEDLPRLRRKDVFALVDIVSREMEKAGWDYEISSRHGKITETRSLTLLPNMRFEVHGGGVVDLEELESLAEERDGVRVSMSFRESGATNRTRGLVAINPMDGRVQIWDSATATLYRPADLDISAKINGIGDGLRRLGLLGSADKADAGVGVLGAREGASCAGRRQEKEEEVLVGSDGRCIVMVGEGDLTKATWLIARWLAGRDDLYRRAGMVTRVVGGKMTGMSDARLAVEIGENVMCAREERIGGAVRLVEMDPPAALVRQVASVVGEVGFRDLRGVVDVPVVRRDGSMLMQDGWDAESGLLVQLGGEKWSIPDTVTRAQALEAVDVLMRPFRGFPLVGPEAKGALLAALLTAIVRPGLDTAPAFALDAPAAGTGKTLLASCIMALAGGGTLYAPLPMRDEAETAKVLLSVLMEKPRVALFDNQAGVMESASLAAVLTSPRYSGRVLGSTRVVDTETNLMVIFSGNNIAMLDDMTRRVLTIRLDAGVEAPSTRRFDFDPLREVKDGRRNMVAAGLTLIRWAFGAGERSRGRIGSFEMWDEIVGQTVAALRDHDFADPADMLRASQSHDPRVEEVRMLLCGLREMFGGEWFSASDVVDALRMRAKGHAMVSAVLENALSKGITSIGVGMFLRFRRDFRVGSMRLQMRYSNTHKKPTMFCVRADDDPEVVAMGSWKAQRMAARDRTDHLSE
jgi:hypothetical protein